MATLYEWAGGESAFERLINAFYNRVETGDLLAASFPGGVSEEHRQNVIAGWSEVFGGSADPELRSAFVAYVEWGPDWRFRVPSRTRPSLSTPRCRAGVGRSTTRSLRPQPGLARRFAAGDA